MKAMCHRTDVQNPADHGAPGDRQLHDERLAGPRRRRAAGCRSGAAIGTAQRHVLAIGTLRDAKVIAGDVAATAIAAE
jgi:hypothetical protein